ncbi:MAG: S1 RNA-binding domain-containing protein [Oscillospiraceae bacterium]|nr:S1 RNA-binding domain-containing protein [Oscillospiraceae bacterium]
MSIPEILEGKVTKIMPYGAFIKLADGRFGMVHISEISQNYVREINDYLKIGDQVKVIVLPSTQNELNFSIKRAIPGAPQDSQPHKKRTSTNRTTNISDGKQKRSCSTHPSFEDMMSKFKQVSDEKLSLLKTQNNRRSNRRGSGKK